ncbi:MAG: FG-GAP-like repeat-containing protein [Spirulina sp.]
MLWESASQTKEIVPQAFLYGGETPLPAGVEGQGNGLLGKYYDELNFNNFVFERTDAQVDFDWQTSSPNINIAADTFSIQWTGQIEALYSETYTFYTEGEEGVRLKVNGQVLIDDWNNGYWEQHSGTIALVAGQKYDIELDYYENGGHASIELLWESSSQTKEIVPQAFLYSGETLLPVEIDINAALANDTGASNSDSITQDATIAGNLSSNNPLNYFKAGFAGTPDELFTDITSNLDGSGNFSLSLAQLETIYGSALSDGEYTLELIAEDNAGGTSDRVQVTFILDTTAPTVIVDSPITTGDNDDSVRLIGSVIEQNGIDSAQYTLDGQPAVTLNVDAAATFNQQFAALGVGSHQAIVQAIDLAGNQGQTTVDFQVVNLNLISLPTSISFTSDITVGDLNGDGIDDIVTLHPRLNQRREMTVLLSQTNSTSFILTSYEHPIFSAFQKAIALGDFDNDSDLDIVKTTPTSLSIWSNNGYGAFTLTHTYSLPITDNNDVIVTDLDGDLKLDLVVVSNVGSYATDALLMRGNGDGSFGDPEVLIELGRPPQEPGETLQEIVLGDIDGDSDIDIVGIAKNPNSVQTNLYMWLNDGSGSMSQSSTSYPSSAASPYQSLELADLNNDNHLDLILTRGGSGGSLSIRFGNGDGSFTGPTQYALDNPDLLTIADVNNDGNLDVFVFQGNPSTNALLFYGSENGTLSSTGELRFTIPASTSVVQVEKGTFNQDDRIDLLVTYYEGIVSFSDRIEIKYG